MLDPVATTPKSLEDYRPIAGDQIVEELRHLAEPLRGARVLHVNATAFGGGVAELLSTIVPLMNDLGLVAEWQVIQGANAFFKVTKAMHNGLQGMFIPWTPEMRETWLHYNEMNAQRFDQDYDFVIVHDIQPAGLLAMVSEQRGRRGKWIWRCHIDLTSAQADVWDFLHPFINIYDGVIFTMPAYFKANLKGPIPFFVAPSIDPLSPKNMPLPDRMVSSILEQCRVDPSRPMIAQISRFDPWKDPLGVIDAYRLVKSQVPNLQLVMVASMAHDDPEGWSYYELTVRRAGEDFDIHILSNLNGVGSLEVNAFQRAARVIVQKSVREGFGLVVSEALWKGRPVVAGNVGGIPLQVQHGRSGYLVSGTEECAKRILYLLRHPRVAARMGAAGREYVRQHFLCLRDLRDHLTVFHSLTNRMTPGLAALAGAGREEVHP